MKYSVFAILLCVFCCFFSAGCVSVMQTSAMLLEDREYSFFPDPPAAVEARDLDGVLYLKCPVRKYVRKHTLVRMAITPSCLGGFQYKPAGPSEDRFVWIKAASELPLFPDPWTFEYDPDQEALKKRLASANHAEVERKFAEKSARSTSLRKTVRSPRRSANCPSIPEPNRPLYARNADTFQQIAS